MNLSQLLSSIFAGIKNDVIVKAVPDLLTFLGNTQKLDLLSLSGQLGYISQLDLLRSSLTAGLTALAPTEVEAINAAISNELEASLQAALTKAQAAKSGATIA